MNVKATLRRTLPAALHPGARRLADAVVPARRQIRGQWRRLDTACAPAAGVVQSGPFAGMQLTGNSTGSHIPKVLGSYEQELHDVVREVVARRPALVLDVGCGEGFYVVGLARLLPQAKVIGFDISPDAQRLCAEAAASNGVAHRVEVRGVCSPSDLVSLASAETVLIVDAEGAEDDLLTKEVVEALGSSFVLVELHDFAAAGVTKRLTERFRTTHTVRLIDQAGRDARQHPLLQGLDVQDATRALSESRVTGQQWLVASPRATVPKAS